MVNLQIIFNKKKISKNKCIHSIWWSSIPCVFNKQMVIIQKELYLLCVSTTGFITVVHMWPNAILEIVDSRSNYKNNFVQFEHLKDVIKFWTANPLISMIISILLTALTEENTGVFEENTGRPHVNIVL